MLPGETMKPQHVMQLLPRQTEVRVIRVCVRVCGVITQQNALQETEEDHVENKLKVYIQIYRHTPTTDKTTDS